MFALVLPLPNRKAPFGVDQSPHGWSGMSFFLGPDSPLGRRSGKVWVILLVGCRSSGIATMWRVPPAAPRLFAVPP